MSTTDRPNDVPCDVEPERPISTVSEREKGLLMGRAQVAADVYDFCRNLGMGTVAIGGGLTPAAFLIGGWTLTVAVVCFTLVVLQVVGSIETRTRRAEGGAAAACEKLGMLGWRGGR